MSTLPECGAVPLWCRLGCLAYLWIGTAWLAGVALPLAGPESEMATRDLPAKINGFFTPDNPLACYLLLAEG